MIRISVVMATYRRPHMLARCLSALNAQTLAGREYEIIVCDDGPDAETEACVKNFALTSRAGVQYIPVRETQGPAAARNCGWRAARGEIVAFTDDDCVPERTWLKNGLEAFDGDPGLSAAMGRIIMPISPVPTDYEKDAAGLERAEFPTANCFYRRGILEKTGGFDERFTAAWREDADLFFNVLERGGKAAAVPRAAVLHPVRPAPWGVSIGQQKKAVYNALIYKKHPELYRLRIQKHPPVLYYAILVSLLCTAAGIAAPFPVLAALGGLSWLLLTGYFVWKRLRGTSLAISHVTEMLVTSALIPPLAVYWRLAGALRYRVFFW